MEDISKTIMFTANSIQNGQPTTIQYQTADGTILKQPKIEGQKTQDFPTFYTTNVGGNTTINLAQLTGDDNKTCYIAQPLSGYNYALVNQMQLTPNGTVAGVATVDNQGRLQIVNKPITNTISNISFKCDVCGLMFSHLTLLNHHKRIHTQTTSDQNQETAITVVSQGGGTNVIQGQTLVSESGQTLGQIQIVATESLEPASLQQQQQQQQQHQQHQQQQQQPTAANEVTVTTANTLKLERSKCSGCGSTVLHTPTGKRKNSKIRCDNCLQNNDNSSNTNHQRSSSTQIFVAPDGDVKFEMSELPDHEEETIESLNHNTTQMVHVQSQQHLNKLTQQQQQQQNHNNNNQHNHINHQGNYPLKKRNLTNQVTKCNKCNGSGVIFLGNQTTNNSNTNQIKNSNMNTAAKPDHPKPFQCNICGGTFSRYSSLWSHKKLHSGEKNYKCEICGLAFAKAVYLKNHSRIHTGEKPYKCATCGMQFSQSPHLKNHERTHSGEKPYVCEVCDKGFARHATLWNHRRIHTGEKPYKCEICGSCFSQAAHLKNHAKVHSGEKPFKCDICSAAFADRFALKRHRGIHEKYGQTAPRQPKPPVDNNQQQQQQQQSLIIHKMEIDNEERTEPTEVIISGL